jgi:hypothetical protein
MKKKSSAPDAVLRKGDLPKAEKVIEAPENVGAAARAIAQQLTSDGVPGTNSSPKARRTNYWGISSEK